METLGLGAECATCGLENPAGARFCNQCGHPLEAEPDRSAERRQITVVFSDLSGFTAMSEHLDPEDVQTVMGEIFARATEIIERYSGRVDKLLGDAVMSVFGDPVAHEDDAERAVRATLEIHEAVDDLSPRYEEEIGTSLRMHSGINTGVVVTSAGSLDTADTGPLGDTINLAARLEDLSDSGEILLGPETARLVRDVFELEDYGTHDLKGKSGSVPVMRVAGFRKKRSGLSHKRADFVGRHEELGVLLGAVERVQDGQGSVIAIKAEAGSGKTRLLEEFKSNIDPHIQWLEGRAYPYGENIPYAALIDLISNAIDVAEGDTPDSISTKLRSVIGPLVGGEERILDPFVRLYGLPERQGAALDKDSFQDRLLESLVAVVDALCDQAPTVLVFQDLHWVDPSTTTIIDRLISTTSVPAVVVVNYRPGFRGTLSGVRELELGALSPRQTGQMVSSLLDDDDPPGELVEFVVDRTDGNPFFIEEIINSLIETGTLVSADAGWEVVGSLAESDLPTSVRGVIAARIDRLDSDRRRVLREASVVGRQFLYEVIKRVATVTATLDPSLADLEQADLIRERSDPDLEYFFKHALTQDVAYEGLLKKERTELHARAAAAIEEQFVGRLGEVTETLAYHYTQAGVVDKAVHYLRVAGTKAMDRYALIEAQSHFEKAYELLVASDAGPERDRELVDLILDWALLFYYRAHLLDLDVLLDRHQECVERLNDETRRMWWLIWRGHADGFKPDQSDNLTHLDQAVEIAERIGDETGYAYARTWQVWAHFVAGRPVEAIAVADSIEDWVTANREEDPYPYFKSRCTAAFAMAFAGRAEEVQSICSDVIDFGRRIGNNRCIAFGLEALGLMHLGLGNYEKAVSLSEEGSTIAKDPIYRDTPKLTIISIAVLSGDLELARSGIAYLSDVLQREGGQLTAPMFVDLVDPILMMDDGKLTAGMSALEEAIERARQLSRAWEWLFGRAIRAITLARIATGDATADLTTKLRNPGFIKYQRKARSGMEHELSSVREEADELGFGLIANFCDVELAKVLIARGEPDRARPLLERALAFTDRSTETEGPDRVRELLAQT